jgi:chromosome partitioning protein
MSANQGTIIAVATQKGGVAKTTTAVNLSHALALQGFRVLVVDMDPQGNASQALGFKHADHGVSVADLLWDRSVPTENAIYHRPGADKPEDGALDVIVANPNLARVERGMSTLTNAELRLAQRLKGLRSQYDFIVVDSAPSFGCLLNSVLNAADQLIVPVDCNVFALHGLQSLLGEIEEIKFGTNPSLSVLGYLMTMVDRTIISQQTTEAVARNFGELAFGVRIRRAVALREAPALGRTIFEHDPDSGAADDYRQLGAEVVARIAQHRQAQKPKLVVDHESISATRAASEFVSGGLQ